MVSPQPLAGLASTPATSSTTLNKAALDRPLVAPSPTMQASINKSAQSYASNGYSSIAAPSMPRLKRGISFLRDDDPQPYLWSLTEEPTNTNARQIHREPSPVAPSAELFIAGMAPMQYAFGEELYPTGSSHPYFDHPMDDQNSLCDQCDQCMLEKQQQFNHEGWPVDAQSHLFDDYSYVKQESFDSPMTDIDHIHHSFQPKKSSYRPDECEEKSVPLAPLSSPLAVVSDHSTRLQGRLTKFLPEGRDMMAVDFVDPNYTTAFENQVQHQSRAIRARKVRSRSPSPELEERSSTPESFADSAYDTDHYEAEEEHSSLHLAPKRSSLTSSHLDDNLSPPVVRYDAGLGSSSGDSSCEPPALTHLLPVSAKDLLPSRPSTAAIPPAHIKDRLVKSAKKLLTASDGVNENVQVQVIPVYFPAKGASSAHKIRLVRVENTAVGEQSVSVYAHASDVGGVVERKSNISRLFGKFESPSEKLLMNVPGAHNHVVGQESNILTSKGVRKFLTLNKMKDEFVYRHWIESVLLPKLIHDPLEIGEEMLEIEASTDPHMPHHIKPKKMARMEKKQQRRAAEKEHASKGHSSNSSVASDASSFSDGSPSKRQKTHSHSSVAAVPTHAPLFARSLQSNSPISFQTTGPFTESGSHAA